MKLKKKDVLSIVFYIAVFLFVLTLFFIKEKNKKSVVENAVEVSETSVEDSMSESVSESTDNAIESDPIDNIGIENTEDTSLEMSEEASERVERIMEYYNEYKDYIIYEIERDEKHGSYLTDQDLIDRLAEMQVQ